MDNSWIKEDDCERCHKGQLESGIKQAGRIGNAKEKCAERQRIDEVDVPPEQFAQEVGHSHYCCPEDRWSPFDKKDVEQKYNYEKRIGQTCRDLDHAKEGE